MARQHEGTNYGGYNLFTNNCLHYVNELLSVGTFQNKTMQKFAINSNNIVPHEYHKYLRVGKAIGIIKGVITGVKEIWKAICSYY